MEVKVFFSSSFLTFFNIDQNVDFFLKINYTVQKMELRRDLGCKDRKYTVGGKNLVILLFVVIMTFCYFMTKMYCTCNTMSCHWYTNNEGKNGSCNFLQSTEQLIQQNECWNCNKRLSYWPFYFTSTFRVNQLLETLKKLPLHKWLNVTRK